MQGLLIQLVGSALRVVQVQLGMQIVQLSLPTYSKCAQCCAGRLTHLMQSQKQSHSLPASVHKSALWPTSGQPKTASGSGFWAAALELVVIETFGVRKYERFSSWDVTLVADTVPKTMH